jgi:hypothetical protein
MYHSYYSTKEQKWVQKSVHKYPKKRKWGGQGQGDGRPQEAPAKVDPAKFAILALKSAIILENLGSKSAIWHKGLRSVS